MKIEHIVVTALVAGHTSARTFSDEISGIPQLSNLSTYLSQNSMLENTFNSHKNVTVLAPDDNAFLNLVNVQQNASQRLDNSSTIDAILRYHILRGYYKSSNISSTSKFVPTMLNETSFSNVSTGQIVRLVKEGTIKCYSGLNYGSQIVKEVRKP